MAKILIVDDHPLYRELAGTLLEDAGHDILVAKDGEEGLRVAEQELPDLILMDLSMPEMDGVATMHRLRQIETIRKIPVVAITAYPEKWAHKVMASEDFQGFIEKPFRPDTFVDDVLSYLAPDKGA